MNQKFDITGMTCSACSAAVERSVKKLDGIENVNVNLLSNSMTVAFKEEETNNIAIIEAVVSAGYGAKEHSAQNVKIEKSSGNVVEEQLKEMKTRLITSFVFLIPLLYIAMGHMLKLPLPDFMHGEENAITFAFTQFLLVLPIIYVNRKYFIVGFKTLSKLSPNMDSLIAIGTFAAVAYGIFAIYQIGYGYGHMDMDRVMKYAHDLYFESAGTILTLITLGKYLETRSKGKTSEAITKLMDLAPKTATVSREGIEIEIPIEEVVIDDIVVIRPGQSIPVDGEIIEGTSSVDQSAITGESIPIEKKVGDKVIAASINKTGSFRFKATRVGDDTTLAQIIQLVEDASSSKAPIAKLADKISGIFVPIVITIAVLASAYWMLTGHSFEFSLSIGIAVLVISCPCALGLATPVAIMVGTGKGASNGILIKSAEALEIAHKIDTVVLDKTGTITEGKPKVTDIITFGNLSKKELLQVAASIEKLSEHPLADAIVEKAREQEIDIFDITDFESISGRGIKARNGDSTYYAGNLAFMQELNIQSNGESISNHQVAEELAHQAKTPLYFAKENSLIGIIGVADVIKKTSEAATRELKAMGIQVVMLTGDNKKTAEAIRKNLSIDRVVADVMPQDKEAEVRKLQESGRKVAMVGDGINDAPALTRADVGIAIGAGTDIAIESADVVLMKGDLLDVVTAIQLSKAVIRNIKENLFWAFFYNIIGIPIAAGLFYYAFGWKLNPMIGAAAMSVSSVCVVSNALRLKFFKPRFKSISSDTSSENKDNNSISNNNKQQSNNQVNNQESDFRENNISNNSINNIKGDDEMKKVMKINGMHCDHCKANAEKALNAIDGVNAQVNLKKKEAVISFDQEVSDEVLTKAITDAGYEVEGIEVKKGLFS
ncbi:heavy metal translocating P-type ATPase [Anaeromicropila herbilytica]|uniref:Copper-exporting P-type ATPase n=1 Tax=Anaeromicropila herbilytica TaxID=2785025 RepID=A0A7R7IEM9_9FIRM|nr:heavy metal translocating P-type ATPase [Anaeromicropila herbilytica]BCN32181.1 heavy metal translocating P-type ATPase [Anaeromicropila herbilytica]